MRTTFAFTASFVALTHFAGAQAPAVATPEQLADGKKNYMMVCVACHQPTGLGLPSVFPPLTNSEYVAGSPERYAAMILKGNAGPMTVDGKLYNNIMPGQEALLTDEKIASIMTFTRQSFGNNAPPVSPEIVAAARKKFADRKAPWTEAELKAWKDDAETTAAGANPPTAAPAPAPAQ
jgi:mono/diheme cytochrome c family protein